MEKDFLFQKKNYIVMIFGIFLIILGFILMSGGGSDNPEVFSDDIFNFRRLSIAPTLVLLGFAVEFYAIFINSDKKK